MSKWEKVRWSEVIEIINGKNQKDVEDINGEYPIYGSGGIIGCANDYLCNENTVIIGRKGNINKPIFVERKFWNVDTAFGLSAKTDKLIPKYLYYFCVKFNFEKLNTTVTIPSLTKNNLLKIEMPLPPIEIQQQIVKTLDSTAELLTLQKQQLAELDNLIKSIFYDMFGDPVVNEKGWEKGKIKDLAASISYGTSKKASTEKLSYPILRMNNITYNGEIDLNDLKYVDLSDSEKEKYLVYKGDLLFNRTNSKELVGKTAVFKENLPMAFAGYLIRLVPNERGNSDFISAFLNSSYGKKLLYNMAKNIIGMANINAREFGDIDIYIPPIDLQNQFSDIVAKIEEQKAQVRKAIDETQTLFDSLMSQYFD